MKIKDHEGVINIDDDIAKELGFTSDKFFMGYLWKIDNAIWISLIASYQGNGYFSQLLNKIQDLGFIIKVPSPLGQMQAILNKKKFTPTQEYNKEIKEMVDVWIKEPS